MASAIAACMNASCGATTAAAAAEWKKGWRLRSGGFASLCDKCGSAFEQLNFCETYHNNESGWRDCSSCGKRLHCGCVASKSLYGLLDRGGVECVGCMKKSGHSLNPGEACVEIPLESCSRVLHSIPKSPIVEKLSIPGTLATFCEEESSPDVEMKDNIVIEGNNDVGCIKKEQIMLLRKDLGSKSFPNIVQHSLAAPHGEKRDEVKETYSITSSSFTLATMNPKVLHPMPGLGADRLDGDKFLPSFQHGQKSRHLLPKPPKVGPIIGLEIPKDSAPQIRVARPPGEGRGRSQLLPRYWPRITEQELQQISGDSNSTIVPLFEKVLSASDAGRIGRLVLPKACAEAYFPPISQPEGLPLKIQDSKGKDWMFQFRFWPNNNSRMYVLEGVTPCIQSMQLQAGDTVTFSRIEPEGKLVMGCRKASNSSAAQDAQVPVSSVPNGAHAKDSFFSGVIDNLPVISGYSGLLKSLKGNTDPHFTALSDHMIDGDVSWLKPNNHLGRQTESFFSQSSSFPEGRKSRNISSKNKRLHIDMEDAHELKLTWEEAQELLRPPPSVNPSIVLVDNHEFEEYEEPPVFGKRTIFTARPFGGQDQWAQCDSCCKWRRLPMDVLLQSRWTCAENVWDPKRSSCAVPDEINPKELADLVRMNFELKKQKVVDPPKEIHIGEQTGLDALASAAVLGDDGNCNPPSTGPTTKHPRHRPGCMCIVCIQPPSGKGPKHKPTCTCNVCLTVKRRFKTLMMRKKKRQMEREAETASKKTIWDKDDAEVDSSFKREELEQSQCNSSLENKVGIDLNCQPDREDELHERGRMSMTSLLQVASFPLETYLKQTGLTSLACEQPVTTAAASPSSLVLPQTTMDSEGQAPPDDNNLPAAAAGAAHEDGLKDGGIEQS